MSIGRCALATDPYEMTHSGDSLSFAIDIADVTVTEAKVLRQQLLGLAGNPDEPVVPVVWSEDPDLDGYYRVVSVSVTPVLLYLVTGLMRCQVSLERVSGGWVKPLIETNGVSAAAVNVHGITSISTFPYATAAYGETAGGSGGSFDAIPTSATGAVRVFEGTVAPSSVWSFATYARTTPYAGAALLEVRRSGVWYPAIGRQIPSGIGRHDWRISNGFIRASIVSGRLATEVWDGSAWQTLPDVNLFQTGANINLEFGTMDRVTGSQEVEPVVLANGPDCVSVRFPYRGGSDDFTVRRGPPVVIVRSTPVGPINRIRLSTQAAVSALTEFDVAGTGADDIGFVTALVSGRCLMVTSTGISDAVNTANGFIPITSAPNRWAVGGVSSLFTYQELARYSYAAVAHSSAVVAR